MQKNEITEGMSVMFGRGRGERTLGRVVKVNRLRVKVQQLTKRGSLKDYPVGTLWAVPPNLLSPASAEEAATAEVVPQGTDTKRVVSIETLPATPKQAKMETPQPQQTEVKPDTKAEPKVEPKVRKPRASNEGDTMVVREKGCPVIVDPNTGYRFVGHKGESVLHFAARVQDILRGNMTQAEKAEVASLNIH